MKPHHGKPKPNPHFSSHVGRGTAPTDMASRVGRGTSSRSVGLLGVSLGIRLRGPRSHAEPGLLISFRLRYPIWLRLLRYALSASSTYRRGYACGSLGRKPCIHNHLFCLATEAGEKSELTFRTISAVSLRKPVRNAG